MKLEDATRNTGEFIVHDDPIMQCATDALMLISKIGKIHLKAKGILIPNAVAVANIIVDNFLKNNSKIDKIILDSEISEDDGKMVSNIEIILSKN